MKQKVNEAIIYSNYKRNFKWKGIIDYRSLFFLIGYIWIIFTILNYFHLSFEKTCSIFFFLVIPIASIFFIHIHNESAVDVIYMILRFLFYQGIFTSKENYHKKREIYKRIL